MSTVVVVGVQWGDEGKGKVVDLLAREADIIVRFQGGSNAGHTLVVGGQENHCAPHPLWRAPRRQGVRDWQWRRG